MLHYEIMGKLSVVRTWTYHVSHACSIPGGYVPIEACVTFERLILKETEQGEMGQIVSIVSNECHL